MTAAELRGFSLMVRGGQMSTSAAFGMTRRRDVFHQLGSMLAEKSAGTRIPTGIKK